MHSYSTSPVLQFQAKSLNRLPDGSYWCLASEDGTISYDHQGRGRKLTARAHASGVNLWHDRPLTGNHKKLGRASNSQPIGVVREGRLNERGDLLLRFTPQDEGAETLLEANLHEGFSIGVRITGIEIRGGEEVIVAYEPDHLTVAFYPEKPSCPKDVCNIVPLKEVAPSLSTRTNHMTTTDTSPTTTTTEPEEVAATTPAEAESPEAEATTPSTPEGAEASTEEVTPATPAEATTEPEAEAAPEVAEATEATTEAAPEATEATTPAEPEAAKPSGCGCGGHPEGEQTSDSTLRAEIEAKDAQLASLRQVVEQYEASERSTILNEIGPAPEGVDYDSKSLDQLRELHIILKGRTTTTATSTATEAEGEPDTPAEGSGAHVTPVSEPEPEEDPREKALREAKAEWEAHKARYKMG